MAIIVEDGTGLPNAESYISLLEADDYHADRGNSDWINLTGEKKEIALRKATDYLIQEYRNRWKGQRSFLGQALDWPRSGVAIDEGFNVDYNVIPKDVKNACAELGLRASIQALVKDQGQRVVSESVGPIRVVYDRYSPVQTRYMQISKMLSPYLNGNSSMIKLGRR